MPLPKWNRRSIFHKLLILCILLVIALIMFLSVGPFFVRNKAEKQTTEIYSSTDQDQEMRIERNVKLHADSFQPEAVFDAPLALKLIVPADQREAVLKEFRKNIQKREDKPSQSTTAAPSTSCICDPPDCSEKLSASADPGAGSSPPGEAAAESSNSTPAAGASEASTAATGSSGATAAGGSASSAADGGSKGAATTAAGAEGSGTTNAGASTTEAGAAAGSSTSAEGSVGPNASAAGESAASRSIGVSASATGTDKATTPSALRVSKASRTTRKASSKRGKPSKEGGKADFCDWDSSKDEGKDKELREDVCDCGDEEDSDKDDAADDDEWCKLDDFCKCYCHKKRKARI